ncbi:contact-dependent growth inhibition system immunity protein [Streptomyces hesseae]|uniref:Contact-dependent growth inhibition system immunity protein n=1 Tax=Streptomyces hesseae TaxID=3075519 RepID=A0ABU2SXT7_9ACTN|nr:contact-dependent growth inhibition system immunity protein [Streptomyces sp. DSM 40473]MDT0453184.1 contact-dependent growth inhibition system immunity protein [Streptomyces sp. DSM 40473]
MRIGGGLVGCRWEQIERAAAWQNEEVARWGLSEVLMRDNEQVSRFVNGSRSLEEIEGVRWPAPPADATRLVATAHALRRKPISVLGPEDLRLLISQDVGLLHLLPSAVELLRADPMVEGDLYEGDLLSAVLTRGREAWAGVPGTARELRTIVSGLVDLSPGLRREADDFLAVVAGL